MKTPKRETEHSWCPIGARYTGTEFLPTLSAKERSRWKRKNRIIQYKRTIARLEREKNRSLPPRPCRRSGQGPEPKLSQN